MVTIISHLALTLSCSISFYIYYGKYGAPKQVMNRRLTKFRSLIRPTNNNKEMEEGVEMMGLPDMDNLVENDINLDTLFRETSFRGSSKDISCSPDILLEMQNNIEYDWRLQDGKKWPVTTQTPLLHNFSQLDFSWVWHIFCFVNPPYNPTQQKLDTSWAELWSA